MTIGLGFLTFAQEMGKLQGEAQKIMKLQNDTRRERNISKRLERALHFPWRYGSNVTLEQIRNIHVPRPEHLVSVDYSKLEEKVMSHYEQQRNEERNHPLHNCKVKTPSSRTIYTAKKSEKPNEYKLVYYDNGIEMPTLGIYLDETVRKWKREYEALPESSKTSIRKSYHGMHIRGRLSGVVFRLEQRPDGNYTAVLISDPNIRVPRRNLEISKIFAGDDSFFEGGIFMAEQEQDSSPVSMLKEAADCISNRAAERDSDSERSMAATVKAFNSMFDKDLTEEEGWHFMALLKMARAKGGEYRRDDYVDGAAYFALAGESRATK